MDYPRAATGNFVDGGRVEDATATPTNGGKWYAYPSLSVNKNGDILLGFSEFESDDYADAGYTLRLSNDAAGTMRDPVIFKEGEDYYEKTFSSTRNRWGDYSHTVVDPVNDRDLWTVQEYAGTRLGATGTGSGDSRWGTWWAKVMAPAAAGDLYISEFRLFGPNGPVGTPAPEPNEDEFIEVYNNNDSPLTVVTVDGSAGYSVAASDGVPRCTIPAGTVIPARGHFLCTNSDGYSLGGHPAGPGTTATGDATYTDDILNNAGIALFNTANTANYSTATRLDAVGSTSEANTLYKEGTGYPALTHSSSTTPSTVTPAVSPVRSLARRVPDRRLPEGHGQQRLGLHLRGHQRHERGRGAAARRAGAGESFEPHPAQRPVRRRQPRPGGRHARPPNRVRDFTTDPANNSTFGTLLIRRTLTNNTGQPSRGCASGSSTRRRSRRRGFRRPAHAHVGRDAGRPAIVSITGTSPAVPGQHLHGAADDSGDAARAAERRRLQLDARVAR